MFREKIDNGIIECDFCRHSATKNTFDGDGEERYSCYQHEELMNYCIKQDLEEEKKNGQIS